MIRSARAADLEALLAMESSLFGQGAWSRASLAGELDEPQHWLAVAPIHGPPRGYISLRCVVDEAELLRVGVHSDFQRQGLARMLIQAGIAWAGERGAQRIFLEVSALNTPARALYLSCGFEPCGLRKGYYSPGVDALLLAKPLGPRP